MKNEYKVWRTHGSYFLKSFPELDVTIVWDDTKKTYNFNNGIIDTKVEKSINNNVEVESIVKNRKKTSPYDFNLLIVGAAAGIILGAIGAVIVIVST